MFHKYWLLLGLVPLAGCVTDSKQEVMTLTAPPVASAASAPSADDPLDLKGAIALVRQQPWCYRRWAMSHQ
jgi:hypothetical protein